MSERVFEMLWDCAYCGTRGLLGQSHRHCPACGAPQDPKRRYFPERGKEVAARNTAYVGADRTCPACATACPAAAKHCPGCGSPLEGARAVARVADAAPTPGQPPPLPPTALAAAALIAPPASSKHRRRGCLIGCAVFLLAAIALLYAITRTRELTARVESHAWRREIAIERFEAVAKSDWCDGLPGDAYGVARSREVRSHRKVADGQDCHTVREDRGDGTFAEREVCTTRYREEPVYDQKCRYSIDRWVERRQVAAAGQGLLSQPAWPAVALAATAGSRGGGGDGGAARGAEREGAHRETYTVALIDARGKHHACEVPEPVWRALEDGATVPLRVRVVSGAADCDALGRR